MTAPVEPMTMTAESFDSLVVRVGIHLSTHDDATRLVSEAFALRAEVARLRAERQPFAAEAALAACAPRDAAIERLTAECDALRAILAEREHVTRPR